MVDRLRPHIAERQFSRTKGESRASGLQALQINGGVTLVEARVI